MYSPRTSRRCRSPVISIRSRHSRRALAIHLSAIPRFRTRRLADLGLVKAGGRQRTDSTHVLGAIRELNRLELAGESLRAALEALAVAAPGCWPG